MAVQDEEISFYIVAHADDWQLFMNPNVFLDLTNRKNKVVIIITTAGDAGMGPQYWAAREEGCKSSVRFCIAAHSYINEWGGLRQMNQHRINYWSLNNATCYFFRLPDGNLDGNGFSVNAYQSLSRLKLRDTLTIDTVDHSTVYNSWEDFCNTLNEVVNYESKGSGNTWINYLIPETNSNLFEHPDHCATGLAIQAMDVLPGCHQALFSGYACKSPASISSTNLFWKIGMLAAYEKAVFDMSGYSTLKEDIAQYEEWCFRNADFITINQQVSKILV